MKDNDTERAARIRGYKARHGTKGNGNDDEPAAELEVRTVPLDFDPTKLEPRGWLLGNTICIGFVSVLLAAGAVGKTAMLILEALSLATGRSLTGAHVFRRVKVLIVSLEDDGTEFLRRLAAAVIHYGISNEDLHGWLHFATPADLGLKLATIVDGTFTVGDLGPALKEKIDTLSVEAVCLDPFIKTHGVGENANESIDQVMTILTKLAQDRACGFRLAHHTTKGPPDPGNADRGRGASSGVDAARLVHTLNPMSTEDAKIFNAKRGEQRFLIRRDDAKVNLTPKAEDATWFKLVGVELGNTKVRPEYPAGDTVQTAERWTPPDLWNGLSYAVLNMILDDLDAGLADGARFSDDNAAKTRAAWQVAFRHLGENEEQCKEIIRVWVKTGQLTKREYEDKKRGEKVWGLYVNPDKRPGQ